MAARGTPCHTEETGKPGRGPQLHKECAESGDDEAEELLSRYRLAKEGDGKYGDPDQHRAVDYARTQLQRVSEG